MSFSHEKVVILSITTTALSTCFLATRRRRCGKDVFAVAFPFVEGFAFALAVAFALAFV
jgi:hypothetical protein